MDVRANELCAFLGAVLAAFSEKGATLEDLARAIEPAKNPANKSP